MTHLRRGARVLRIGHRGAAALERENTLAAFQRANEVGVDFVEFDVLDLADGTLVLAHSDDLLEVSHGLVAGRVRPLRLEELREVAPELPTLDEALEFLSTVGVGLQADVKSRRHGREIAAALRRHGLVERAVASSFWRTTPGAARPASSRPARTSAAASTPSLARLGGRDRRDASLRRPFASGSRAMS